MFTYEYIQTFHSTGVIIDREDVTNIVRGVSFDWNVGDEFYIKTSELSIKTTAPLPYSPIPTTYNWLVVWRDAFVHSVFYIGNGLDLEYEYLTRDDKTGLYTSTLPSIDKVFYDHLKSTNVEYSALSESWNFHISQAQVTLDRILGKDDTGTYSIDSLDRAGFSLTDMILWMGLKTNNFGYFLSTPVLPFPFDGDDDLPIIYRGASRDIGETAQVIIDHNFTGSGLKWIDLFRYVIFAYNSFVKITPDLSGLPEELVLGLSFIPKTQADLVTAKTFKWIDRKFVKYKYRIDGVDLTGGNFSYQQGNVEKGNTFSRAIDIYDPDERVELNSEKLFWSNGTYQSGTDSYSIVSGGLPQPYFKSGVVESYYDNMLSNGHGYEGKIKYEGQVILDQGVVGSDTFQLNRIKLKDDGIATVEGLVL